jgi:putative DNA primase/helicase
MKKTKVKVQVSKAATASAVERFARADRSFAVTSENWNADPYLLGTPSGVVDLRTGHLRPASPSDMITKITSVGPAPVGTRAPTWERFLNEATKGDLDLQRFLAQIAGYCLTGDVSEECLFFVHGNGGNGKGVFMKTLTAIIGNYATSTAIETFTQSRNDRHPTELASLAGARMVTASETDEGRSWAEARIKELTGNENPVSARFMRQDFFEFMPTFKIIIVGNHKPILNNVDDAARRRFNIIPFTNKPTTVDPHLKVNLVKEYPAILRWMIDGCLDWQKNRLVKPDVVIEATKEYFDSQDVFGQWIAECCEIHPGNKELFERSADLYESWVCYCDGHGEEPGKERDLGTKLTKIDVGKMKKRLLGVVTAIRTGIRLRVVQKPDHGEDPFG